MEPARGVAMSLSRWVFVGAAVVVCAAVAVLLVPGTEQEETPPELSLNLTLDKDSYRRAESVNVTVTVHNRGRVASGPLSVDCASDPVSMPLPLGDGSSRIPLDGDVHLGVVEPQESASGTAHGEVTQEAYDTGVVVVSCLMTVAGLPYETQLDVPVTGPTTPVTGRFTVCTHDGPGAEGVRLTLERLPSSSPAPPPGPFSATTDANGAFTIPAVPAGLYQLTYEPPAG